MDKMKEENMYDENDWKIINEADRKSVEKREKEKDVENEQQKLQELGQMGVTFMAGTYSKKQGILLKVIQINGAWIVKDKNGNVRYKDYGEKGDDGK
jgi:hypothetical protein